ncbi:MAG: response regulator [Chitinivibrionia bacterium]|nr:response regulator [Chitinivibrionia bacterium]
MSYKDSITRKTAIIRKLVRARPLRAQIFFTVLAFLSMFFLSYHFASKIVRAHLVQNTENMLYFIKDKVESYLHSPKVALTSLSETMRAMILRGYSEDELRDYVKDMYENMCVNELSSSSISNIYAYIEAFDGGPLFISGLTPPANYVPKDRPWYKDATAAGNDKVIETKPYVNVITNEPVFSYTRNIFDDDGKLLGIVAINVNIREIGEFIVNMSLSQGGYGFLVDKNFLVLAHHNLPFVGKNMSETPPGIFVNTLAEGMDVKGQPMQNYRGENALAFFTKLSNGWFVGTVARVDTYYENVYKMMIYLGVTSVAFAAIMIFILIGIDAARIKADMESRYKSAFLANMSHEIRTPMNAIIGMTSIGKTADDVKRKDYCFSKIEDASKHLLGVINDILDMSKIEANKLELSPTEFDFEKMLQRVVNVVNFRVGEKRQDLSVRIDKSIPNVLVGDDQRLAQVITNLLSNAAKFTSEGGSIHLDTRFMGEENGLSVIQFRVKDTGIGISPEQQENLFQSFQQAETGISRRFGGTGLGLSISKSIVQMMGGKIWVESELGKGATFIFEIPMAKSEKQLHSSLKRGVNWSNVRVLVVDDDKNVLTYIQEIMRGFGVSCDIAANGEEALNIVKQKGAYNIYFVDWRMPGIDGIKLTSKLKESGYADPDKTVVIMISAAELNVVEVDAKKAGVDKFLSKPLFPSAIMDILNEFLDVEPQKHKTSEKSTNFDGYFEGYRVLLAEDVKVNCEIVQALFEPTLLKIDCVENGLEAIDAFAENPDNYDLIFMDVQMPVMDGYEATRRIRLLNIDKAKTIPIIAMTANVFKEDIERCKEVGMNDHVGKPLDFDDVAEKLRKYLPKRA